MNLDEVCIWGEKKKRKSTPSIDSEGKLIIKVVLLLLLSILGVRNSSLSSKLFNFFTYCFLNPYNLGVPYLLSRFFLFFYFLNFFWGGCS